MMIEALTVDVGGHALVLSAARAAFDPVLKTLFVADAHFGKDAVFRARGIPVPEGSTAETLGRLDVLISMHRPVCVVFLGDLLHARESHAAATLRVLAEWRSRHAGLRLILVEGNHDRHAGGPPEALGMEVVDEPYRLGPWALCHYPQRVAGAFALAGHEHPVYRVATRRDSVRLPCFRFAADAGVLPAFGAFTGGYEVNENARNERIFVVAGERVMAVRPQSQAPQAPQAQ